EIVGRKKFMDLLTPASRALCETTFARFKELGSVAGAEFEMVRKDGSTFPVLLNATAIRDAQGRFVMSRSMLIDVTDKLAAEVALKESRAFLNNLIESSLDMIVASDAARRITLFNAAAQKCFGYEAREILGQPVGMLYGDATGGGAINETILNQGRWVGEIVNRRKNGDAFPSVLAASLLRDARGDVVGMMGISRDITDQKQREAEREKLIRDLEEALANVKTLSGFLPICAHCKKIRDDAGYWSQVEAYISRRTAATFTHSYCPECSVKMLEAEGIEVPEHLREATRNRPTS
ncbi:MAG TPA: PAS domain-containing protein, partial [Verrucomicrobiae bacterium]